MHCYAHGLHLASGQTLSEGSRPLGPHTREWAGGLVGGQAQALGAWERWL